MRPIKYRVWDKEDKIMRNVAMLLWENGRMSRIAAYEPNTHNNGWTDSDPEEGRYELMQFTGLLDRNGKMIWEGDIVSFYLSVNDICRNKEPVVTEVSYDNACFIVAKINDIPYFLAEAVINFNRFSKGGVEIIGNIYEHPELLTKTV